MNTPRRAFRSAPAQGANAAIGARVQNLGQVFTREAIVQQMLALRRNAATAGRTLEPAAGNGAFSRWLPGCVALEIDASIAAPGTTIMDFFAYPETERFTTIIGNPPYVRYRDILPQTRARLRSRLFDRRSNLYLFFIEKCVRHLEPGGELIFITPRDFIKLTAARKLNAWLAAMGTITDFIETGDSAIFGPYVPNCAIFRFEKGRTDRSLHDGRQFLEANGQLLFLRDRNTVPLGGLFQVKVGAVSGADEIFTHPDGNREFVCSTTRDTGATRRMFYDLCHPQLEMHRERLLARRIRPFDHGNWWLWGRRLPARTGPRIYVNHKTRRARPFFLHPCDHYDGSVLALFPHDPGMDLARATALLNDAVDWQELGFVCDGRYLFAQRSLETCLLPREFAELSARIDPGLVLPSIREGAQ
ncbi:MAG: hypothetical protein AMXMBFR6_14330 [Betaproteobacteria bacterium]